MPLRPLISAQQSLPNDNRLTPGRVVEYEQHSKPILAVTVTEKRGKWGLLNQSGGELDLPVDRLTLLPGALPKERVDSASKIAFLSELLAESESLQAKIDLEDVWQLLLDEKKDASVADVTEIVFASNHLPQHLAVRRALLADQVYFKRKKTAFEPRPEHVVEELKVKVRVEEEKRQKRQQLIEVCAERLRRPETPLPDTVSLLEQLAAMGKSAEGAKDALELVDAVAAKAGMTITGRPEDRAFKLLAAMKHFGPDENLLPLRLGRPTRFSQEAIADAKRVAAASSTLDPSGREDLRGLTTITIDGDDTKDFDDALSLERTSTGFRIGIHISDVASLLEPGSILNDVAIRRATSIYCPDQQFSMLPSEVSEEALSLIEGRDRYAVSFFIDTDSNFTIIDRRVTTSIICVTKRITYDEADRVLYGEDDTHPYREMLHLLWDAAVQSEAVRMSRGALQLNRRELNPKVLSDGRILLEESNEDKAGRKLVSEMMILANETAALFGRTHSLPLVYRGQEPPDADVEQASAGIPDGPAREYVKRSMLKRSFISYEPASHAGLGVEAYIHATSPIRRMVDLINQRQLVTFVRENRRLYSSENVGELLARVEQGLDEAQLIQRNRTRYWLLKYLVQEQIKELDATVIRLDGPKPLAEIHLLCSLQAYHPLGKIDRSEGAIKRTIGKQIRLRVDSIDPRADVLVLREVE